MPKNLVFLEYCRKWRATAGILRSGGGFAIIFKHQAILGFILD
jgi:hypothetical protein